jgi:hypothetical protein
MTTFATSFSYTDGKGMNLYTMNGIFINRGHIKAILKISHHMAYVRFLKPNFKNNKKFQVYM